MGLQKSAHNLAKLLDYILGRHPDEFGLVPDGEGWVKIKELLNALSEEAGWGYVRVSHLNEILLTVSPPPVEITDTRIRARDRSRLPGRSTVFQAPKLMYTCVRSKAHPVAMTHGIQPAGRSRVVLSSERDLAEKMGRRRDRQAVTLTVQVLQAVAAGVVFEKAGENIFTAGPIPPGCFSGPALPKEGLAPRPAKQAPVKAPSPGPGSFFLDLERSRDSRKNEKSLHLRKESNGKKPGKRRRREPPPWRKG